MTQQTPSQSADQASRKARHDRISGLVLIATGAFLFNQTFLIPLDPYAIGVGPRFFPQSLCVVLAGLGLLLILSAKSQDKSTSQFDGKVFISRVLPLVVVTAIYLTLFWFIGYLFASMIAIAIAAYFFDVRGKSLVLLAVIASLIFYYLFFGLMGVFEPPSQLATLLS